MDVNDLKVGWTKNAKLSHLRAWLFAPLILLL